MKRKNWDFIVYLHSILFLLAAAFFRSLYLDDGGKAAGILGAIGMLFFLFVDIPLAIFSFVLVAKGCFRAQYKYAVLILAILNFCAGIAAWIFAALVLQMP